MFSETTLREVDLTPFNKGEMVWLRLSSGVLLFSSQQEDPGGVLRPGPPCAYVDVTRLRHMEVKRREKSLLLAALPNLPQELPRKNLGANEADGPEWVIVVHLLSDGRWIRHRETCLELFVQDADELYRWAEKLQAACPRLCNPLGSLGRDGEGV